MRRVRRWLGIARDASCIAVAAVPMAWQAMRMIARPPVVDMTARGTPAGSFRLSRFDVAKVWWEALRGLRVEVVA